MIVGLLIFCSVVFLLDLILDRCARHMTMEHVMRTCYIFS